MSCDKGSNNTTSGYNVLFVEWCEWCCRWVKYIVTCHPHVKWSLLWDQTISRKTGVWLLQLSPLRYPGSVWYLKRYLYDFVTVIVTTKLYTSKMNLYSPDKCCILNNWFFSHMTNNSYWTMLNIENDSTIIKLHQCIHGEFVVYFQVTLIIKPITDRVTWDRKPPPPPPPLRTL